MEVVVQWIDVLNIQELIGQELLSGWGGGGGGGGLVVGSGSGCPRTGGDKLWPNFDLVIFDPE